MSDDELLEMSVAVDRILIMLAEKNKTSALSLSAVVMARMMLLCDSVGSGNDFRQLCLEVSNPFGIDTSKTEVVH